MSQSINGIVYYQTNEACRFAGISRATFFRWLKEGTIEDVKHKDRRGWRLFTEKEIDDLKREAQKITGLETD
jgi:predicted site-specific integrase-resolvase